MTTRVAISNICSAFSTEVIGSKVIDRVGFNKVLIPAIEAYDFSQGRVPGQAIISIPEAMPFVSCGVGKPSPNPSDYVLREHRGRVNAYLKRWFAAKPTSCSAVIYTMDAYLKDRDVTSDEAHRVNFFEDYTHVIVALLVDVVDAAEKPVLSPYRLVHNLAGGNHETETYTADEIRTLAKQSIEHASSWDTVAD